MSGSRLNRFQGYCRGLQGALSPLKMSARAFLTGGIVLCLLFCIGGKSAFAQIAAGVTVAKDSSSSSNDHRDSIL